MGRPVSYSIVNCPDGRFAVAAVSGSGSLYRRSGFLTLAEVDRCVDDLRAAMVACGAPLVCQEAELPNMDFRGMLGAPRSPFQ